MICQAFIEIKTPLLTTFEASELGSLPAQTQHAFRYVWDRIKRGERWHKTNTRNPNAYVTFNSLFDVDDLTYLEATYPGDINVTMALTVDGVPPGVVVTNAENGARQYSGTPIFPITGQRLANWVTAMNKTRPVYNDQGQETGSTPVPKGSIPLWEGGWPNPDVAWFEANVAAINWV